MNKIEVIDHDSGHTVAVYALSLLGVTLVACLIAILYIIIKGSCPYVYAHNGEVFVMEGEIYSGAIFKGLERHDYLPLPDIKPVDGSYQIRISNELKEHQHTNLANLVVIQHPEGSRVLMDQEGEPYLLTHLTPPAEAVSEMGRDLLAQMQAIDRDVFLFNEEEADANNLYLSFPRPSLSEEGVLMLNLKNTLWGDFVYGEFSKKIGHKYNTWIEKQNRKPTEKIKARMDEMGFPLLIYLETDRGWELIQNTSLIGPLSDRDIAVPVDLSRVKGDRVHLRLASSFMFWEIDQALLGIPGTGDMKIRELKPEKAISTSTSNAREVLLEDDGLYLDQWEAGDVTQVFFEAPEVPEEFTQTCFLHSKGYYNHIRDYETTPQLAELFKFKEPGYFDLFSKELYRKIANGEDFRLSSN